MYLGLDLGTSGLRGLLVSAQGNAVGDAAAEYAVQNPKEGWSEQDPAVWIEACQKVMSRLRSNYPKEYVAIKGNRCGGSYARCDHIGRTGQSNSALHPLE